ncbi:M28 family peptidase [Sphingomonas sp.]|uniref:M28 family peptidase n=1 Tax=Sphingomonas sp. TaxID=28214 RepID=UPI0031E24F3A
MNRSALTIALVASAAVATSALARFSDAPSAAALKAHTVFLAHDLLEGRDTGSRGYDIAAQYVASNFLQAGLEPAGTEQWLQPVPLRRRSLEAIAFDLKLADETIALANGDTVAIDASPRSREERLDLPLVFAGWGITAPELGFDDYAGLDVSGKAVVVIEGAPASMAGALRAHYSWVQQKERMAAAAGAAAIVTIKSPARERFSPWSLTRQFRPLPAVHWRANGAEHIPAVQATISLSPHMASRLFASANLDLARIYNEADANPPRGFAFNARIALERRSRHEDTSSPNVIGRIAGSDPALRNEHVVVLAHLDHVGVGKPVNGDSIYNGAIDNAGGVAVLLEAARLLRAAKPKRSILFVATTGEEKGLIGADYFATFPTVERSSIVAAISVDGLMAWHDYTDIVALGADHSTLGVASAIAAAATGARHVPDPIPERGNLALSDQYPFLRLGIPVLFPNPGPRDAKTGLAEHPAWTAYEQNSYHKPSDEASLPIRWDVAARWARYITLTIENAANGPRPAWYAGDPLAKGFAPGAKTVPRRGER